MNPDGVNSFERFSLRAARLLLVCSIAIGCLAIAIGLLVAGGAWLLPGPKKAQAPAPPVPAKLTMETAQKWAEEHPADIREVDQGALGLDDPGTLPSSVASLFPEHVYARADVVEEFCRVPSDYGCLQRGKRIKKPSAARTFTALFHGVADRRRDELLGVLNEHLPPVPIEKRLSMVVPILMGYIQVQQQNKEAADAYAAKVKEIEEDFRTETAAHTAKQGMYSIGGVSAAGWGLGCVISASVFVALLAIERHLRELRRMREETASAPKMVA